MQISSGLAAVLLCFAWSYSAIAQETRAERIQRQGAVDIATSPAKYLQVILIGDTEDERVAAARDLERITKLLKDSFQPQEYGTIRILEGVKANKDELFRAIASLPPVDGPRTIFVYVSSHGHFDDNNRHILEFGHDNVSRDEIVEQIMMHRPRLAVVLTDACAVKKNLDPQKLINVTNWEEGKKLIARLAEKGPLPTHKSTVRGLLLSHQGVVDINACGPGRQAFTDMKLGGFFTNAFALAACHDQSAIAPPPARAKVPEELRGKREGKDFRIALHRVDRDRNNVVDWHEFMDTLVANYSAIFHGAANQPHWVIRLNARDLIERNAPPGIEVYFGVASATARGVNGVNEIGIGRTFFVSPNQDAAREFIARHFPNRKDVDWAQDVDSATAQMEKVFKDAFHNEQIIEQRPKIILRPKFAKPPVQSQANPPQPGHANIYNREYMEWLEKYHPDNYKKLMEKYGDQIRRGRP